MKYSNDCITAMRHIVIKVGVIEDRLYLLTINIPWRCVFQMSGLDIYNKVLVSFFFVPPHTIY